MPLVFQGYLPGDSADWGGALDGCVVLAGIGVPKH